ncbi:glycosyltransferase family 2 protein [uncultured Bifidobacterium sp.]|uniref:dolichyl-phosphate beta-glucosyltransferase n=1 Tax=uncultured Bifidobacterium sp. TaxID=165187 RepID=UPI0028DB7FBA|nr:glycosyltransferase family 2 protein [uncultured Bifidobacterium sp.]
MPSMRPPAPSSSAAFPAVTAESGSTRTPSPAGAAGRMSHGVIALGDPRPVDVDIVIPVYNEQQALEGSVRALCAYLYDTQGATSPFSWNVVIADNASTDSTWSIARSLHERWPLQVRALHIDRKGRGFALKVSWLSSRARVVAYMDADLSTDIRHTGRLVLPLLRGEADLSCGCRLDPRASVVRSWTRETISRAYNRMLRAYLGARFRDAQCGFKAMTRAAAGALLPRIEDDEWFFDTELLMKAQLMGMRLLEVPVHWIEDRGTTVNIPDTVAKDLKGMRRLKRESAVRFQGTSGGEGTGEVGDLPDVHAMAGAVPYGRFRASSNATTASTTIRHDPSSPASPLSWGETGQRTLPGSLMLTTAPTHADRRDSAPRPDAASDATARATAVGACDTTTTPPRTTTPRGTAPETATSVDLVSKGSRR